MPKFKGQTIHYDIVGSFLRPERLKNAREDFENKAISIDELTSIENEEIKKLVQKEAEVGLKFVTDGEFRRSWWHLDTFWGFNGIKKIHSKEGYQFHDRETRRESARVNGKISFNPDHPDLKAFKYLYKVVHDLDLDVIPRQSIPSPAQCYAELVRDQDNRDALHEYYDSHEEVLQDLSKAYHDLILALYDAGCRDLKFDDCTWGMLADPKAWQLIGVDAAGAKQVQQQYLEFNNSALRNLPEDLRTSTHVCRGNYASTWASSGGYEPVAQTLFGKENVSAFYLEFDDDRSGDFTPLEDVPFGKEVVLGLVTSKQPKLEDPEVLKKRLLEASDFVDFEHLSLSTQCGFASTEEGNHLTEKEQWKKIKLVIDTAESIWSKETEDSLI